MCSACLVQLVASVVHGLGVDGGVLLQRLLKVKPGTNWRYLVNGPYCVVSY